MRPTPLVLPAALATGIGCAGCTDLRSINETTTDQRTFPLARSALVVESSGADLRLVTGDAGEVRVDRTLTGKATADGNASWSMTGDRLSLRVVCSGFVRVTGATTLPSDPRSARTIAVAAGTTARVRKAA